MGEYFGGDIVWLTPTEIPKNSVSLITDSREHITELGLRKSSAKRIREGAVLLTSRASIGYVAVAGTEVTTNQGFASFICKDGIHNFYLAYWLKANVDLLKREATGTTFKEISKTRLRPLKFPLAPYREQKRIVSEIEKQFTRLDAAVANLKRVQANLDRYKASVLKAACEGRLVPQDPADEPAEVLLERILAERRSKWEEQEWAKLIQKAQKKVAQARRKQSGRPARISDLEPEEWQELPEEEYGKYLPKNDKWKEKYKEPEPVDTAGLPELPAGWVWARAEQICDFITKGTTPRADKLFAVTGEIPFIKVYNLTFDGTLNFDIDPTFVSRATHTGKLARSKVYPGDVLMNIVGPPLGKVSIVPSIFHEWNMNQAVSVFRPMQSYNNRYLAFALMSEKILDWAKKRAKATAGQFNLTLQVCRDLPIPVPPLNEQKRIVKEVDRLLSVAHIQSSVIDDSVKRSQRLRQAILEIAFTGHLAPQDPNDEPAMELLGHLQAL